MKWNKRIAIESVIVSLAFLCIYVSWPIVQGLLLTNNNVPDIISSYESVDYLQSSIAFGSNDRQSWIIVAISAVLVAGSYYGLRRGLKYVFERNSTK